jgi:hypothetical protein
LSCLAFAAPTLPKKCFIVFIGTLFAVLLFLLFFGELLSSAATGVATATFFLEPPFDDTGVRLEDAVLPLLLSLVVTLRSVRGVTMGAFLCGIGLKAGCSSSSWLSSLAVSSSIETSCGAAESVDASMTAASLLAGSIATIPLDGMVNVGPKNTGQSKVSDL